MFLFLHEKGYTFMTLPQLTYPEINVLIDAVNRKEKKRAIEEKKQMNKNKSKRKYR